MTKTKLDKWIGETESLPQLTREALETLQLERLNATLSRLKERGGIYSAFPPRLESLSELEKLPFTTAEMLSASPQSFLVSSQSEVSRVISGATSGTTGLSKRVFYTERDTEHTVGFFAAGISEMLSAGEKCLIAFPFTGPFGLGDLIAKAVEHLDAVPVKAGYGLSWGELCALVRDTRPQTYIGFPTALLGLIRVYGEDFPVRRALVSGDACPDGVMKELERSLGSKLYPHYGSRECGLGGAVTCPAFEGMHLRENHIIPEIVDEQGRVLPEGSFGELVITTIGLEAMPLIRYRTGDYTRILPPCPCGGVTKRIDKVLRHQGRISMEKLDGLLFAESALVDYRAIFDGELVIEAVLLSGAAEQNIIAAVNSLYPEISLKLKTKPYSETQVPMYSGKRHVIGL